MAMEAKATNKTKPPSYKKEDKTGRYNGDWDAGYKAGITQVVLAAGKGAHLTLLEIKNALLDSLPKGHDFVFDDVALIDAVNTGIYLGQFEMIRRGNDPAHFKLKEEFIRKRNEALKKLGRVNECTEVGGEGSK